MFYLGRCSASSTSVLLREQKFNLFFAQPLQFLLGLDNSEFPLEISGYGEPSIMHQLLSYFFKFSIECHIGVISYSRRKETPVDA